MSRTTILIAVLVVVAVLGGGYLFYTQGPSVTALSTTAGPASDAEETFINLAGELDPISFPTAIFSDPRFTSLTDTRTALTPEVPGRSDPFAPLPGAAAAQ